MCCDDKKQLINLLKDIEKIMEMKTIEPHLGRLNKYLEQHIVNEQRKTLIIDVLRIFVNQNYYSRKKKIEKMKKYFTEKKIPFKIKCDKLGKKISSSYWGLTFYESYTDTKIIIKEKIITHYNIKSDISLWTPDVSSILDEIDIFKKLEKEDFTSTLLDYYMCEKNDDLILYMEIEKKGISLSKWLEDDNILTEAHKKSIKELMEKLHKLDIVYNSKLEADNLLIDTKSKIPKFYISNFEESDTIDHIFSKAKKEDMEKLESVLEWATPYEENILKSLIICDIGVKFTF